MGEDRGRYNRHSAVNVCQISHHGATWRPFLSHLPGGSACGSGGLILARALNCTGKISSTGVPVERAGQSGHPYLIKRAGQHVRRLHPIITASFGAYLYSLAPPTGAVTNFRPEFCALKSVKLESRHIFPCRAHVASTKDPANNPVALIRWVL